MNPIHCGQESRIAEVAAEALLVVTMRLAKELMMAEMEGQMAVPELSLKLAVSVILVTEEAVAHMAALKELLRQACHWQVETVLHIMVLVAAVVLNITMYTQKQRITLFLTAAAAIKA